MAPAASQPASRLAWRLPPPLLLLLLAPALAQVPGVPQPAAATGVGVQTVQLEAYYGTTCPNCQNAFHQAFVPLVEAGLPGDRVQLTVLPWPSDPFPPAGLYTSGMGDYFSEVELCMVKRAFPGPIPIDSPAVVAAVKFLACDLDYTNAAFGSYGAASLQACAQQAGLPLTGPDGVETCRNGKTSMMASPAYAEKVRTAMARHPLHAPFLFLNGEPLQCSSPTWCTSIWTPNGDRPLPRPGSLIDVICSMLSPMPEVCTAHVSTAGAPGVVPAYKKCTNCEEVGPFYWHRTRKPGNQLPLALCAGLGGAAVLGLFLFRQLRHRVSASTDLGENAEALVE